MMSIATEQKVKALEDKVAVLEARMASLEALLRQGADNVAIASRPTLKLNGKKN